MSTKRAMQYLQDLIELDERAETQLSALAGTLKQVVAQMDAILEDADQSISEVLAEQTTGKETNFILRHEPVKIGSIVLKVNSKTVAKTNYTIAGNTITPATAIPAGNELRAEYIVLGLKTQTAELITIMDDLKISQFTARKVKYQQAIQWIETNA